eukprot:3046072-Amphidinium_carterae.1
MNRSPWALRGNGLGAVIWRGKQEYTTWASDAVSSARSHPTNTKSSPTLMESERAYFVTSPHASCSHGYRSCERSHWYYALIDLPSGHLGCSISEGVEKLAEQHLMAATFMQVHRGASSGPRNPSNGLPFILGWSYSVFAFRYPYAN